MGGLLFYQALPFLNGTLGAITLYILLRRVNLLLSVRFSPQVAPWIITIAVTIFVMIPLSIFLWYLIDLVQSVNFDVQVIIKKFTDTIRYLERTTHLQIVSEKSVAFITAKGTAFINMLMGGINNAAINLFTTILLLFFLLAGGIRMERYIAHCLPFSDENKHTIISKVSTIVRSNAIGIPLLALIQGAVAAVGYWFCGVNNPIEFGALTGFASMIPIVGSMLVWIPLAIVQYFEHGALAAVYIALYGAIVISQCDNILRMFMQKRMANTHPLITIFGVIAGLPLFGFMGLIFGPLLVAMFLLFLEMFIKQYILGTEMTITAKKGKNKGKSDPSPKGSNGAQELGNTKDGLLALNSKRERNSRFEQRAERAKERKRKERDAKAPEQTSQKIAKPVANDLKPSNTKRASIATKDDYHSAPAQDNSKPSELSAALPKIKHKSSDSHDFKSAKAESKQQKREAAKIRAHEEKMAHDRALAHQTLSLEPSERKPINLADRYLNERAKEDIPGKNLVARAVSQAINSFDKFDDLDNNMAFGGSDFFKDDFLTPQTKEHIAKKRAERKAERASARTNERNSSKGHVKDSSRRSKSTKTNAATKEHAESKSHSKKGERNNMKKERAHSPSASKNSHKRSRREHLDYQVMRPERRASVKEEPMLRTVVSHQYGNFDLNKSGSGLKTQLVSMHTAKGTVRAEQPRRRPSKRRPYHH